MLAALGTSGTCPALETERGHWPPVGSWTWQARKGRVRSGPWALSGTSQGGKGRDGGRKEPPLHPMVPGLQGSRSAQARFPRSAEPDIVSMSISLSLSMSMSLISLE